LCEIGILNNKSINCWRKYFANARIYGFEYNSTLIDNAKKDNLVNVFYDLMDVKNPNSISNTFKKQNEIFDIIIEDSTHVLNDQLNVIDISYSYLKDGGYLIIEDIFKNCDLNMYIDFLNNHPEHKFRSCFIVDANHSLMDSKNWNNDRLLILIK
jgi:cephalosporin hydroxylase